MRRWKLYREVVFLLVEWSFCPGSQTVVKIICSNLSAAKRSLLVSYRAWNSCLFIILGTSKGSLSYWNVKMRKPNRVESIWKSLHASLTYFFFWKNLIPSRSKKCKFDLHFYLCTNFSDFILCWIIVVAQCIFVVWHQLEICALPPFLLWVFIYFI